MYCVVFVLHLTQNDYTPNKLKTPPGIFQGQRERLYITK